MRLSPAWFSFDRLSPVWRPRLIALGAGLACGLAHPPFGILPGLLGYAVLLHLLEGQGERPLRQAFLRGWLAGVGYFAVGVWWITEPFMVDAAAQGWMAPFALLLMGGGLALFWGLAALLHRLAAPRGWTRPFVFAGALTLTEFLRGHILTGFPWNLPGETWAAGSAPSQAAAYVGAYGLTWMTVALASSFVLLRAPDRSARMRAAVGIAGALGLLYGAGAVRLAHSPAPAPDAPRIRLVQANIDQKEKWRPENLNQIFATYLELTARPGAPDVIVWPEGALPAVIDDLLVPGRGYLEGLTRTLKPGQTLMTGANRVGPGPDGRTLYYNSLIALRREAPGLVLTGVYDKHRLVPFGEFLPLGGLAGKLGIRSLVHMPEDFTAGAEPAPLQPQGVPALQPLICYEALFPGFTRQAARRGGRPAWILNVSNDAWFGGGSGPLQHLNIAAYRAIEEGLPIARATPTGVTAMIDASGRILPGKRLGLGGFGVVDAQLPAARPPTPYSRHGETFTAILLLLSVAMAGVGRRDRK
ncbi:apolipoprotein N-acyltransferase [Phenylobacterium conjunctum]|uniref:Apolipoprotein N-acyltransferase n=1 Tax=Phenylobacterium conjunctum TaxID=1298959 RepID=A0ABW3T6E1_9CAUL